MARSRLTSDMWVSALCRRVSTEGAFAYVAKRGAHEAGSIYLIASGVGNSAALYGPAPQAHYDDEATGERLFEMLLDGATDADIQKRLESESRFDPDIWVVEIEDRDKRLFWDVVPGDQSV